jgi:hypothetical protein
MKRAPRPVDDGRPYHNGPLWRQLYCCAAGDPHSLATGENRKYARQGGGLCSVPKKRARDQGWRVPTMVGSPPSQRSGDASVEDLRAVSASTGLGLYARYPADTVEKLDFLPRSQFRRPLAASMENSLGAQRSDRSFCVRPSLRPCCGNYPCRTRYARGSGIFAAPQFPTFSTISQRIPAVQPAVAFRPIEASKAAVCDVRNTSI